MTATQDQDPWKPVVREFARNLDMGKDWKPIPIQPAVNLAWRTYVDVYRTSQAPASDDRGLEAQG